MRVCIDEAWKHQSTASVQDLGIIRRRQGRSDRLDDAVHDEQVSYIHSHGADVAKKCRNHALSFRPILVCRAVATHSVTDMGIDASRETGTFESGTVPHREFSHVADSSQEKYALLTRQTSERNVGADAVPIDYGPLINVPTESACELIVAIPARDEAGTIVRTLEALARQIDSGGMHLAPERFEVILLANNCRDETVERAREVGRRKPDLRLQVVDIDLPEHSHVGHARRMAMDEALRRFTAIRRPGGVIASTDADTVVANTWVHFTLAEVEKGADAVGGRITLDRSDLNDIGPRRLRYHLLDVGYRSLVTELESLIDPSPHDPWPRHFQHFGASMAVTADAYRRAGGLPVKPYLEDVELYDRLVCIDARIRHSPDVQVTTSSRPAGRTSFGFAVQLERWEQMERNGLPFYVQSAGGIETRVRALRDLRHTWESSGPVMNLRAMDDIADRLCIPAPWLACVVSFSGTYGSLIQQVISMQEQCGVWAQRWPAVDIRTAIRDLRYRLDELKRSSICRELPEQIEPVRRLTPVQDVN